jgi:hypothetical protein
MAYPPYSPYPRLGRQGKNGVSNLWHGRERQAELNILDNGRVCHDRPRFRTLVIVLYDLKASEVSLPEV